MIEKKVSGSRLRELRKAKGLSLKDVADQIGIYKPTLSNIERGVKPASLEMVITLADFFDVSIDYLVGRSDDPQRILSALGITLGEFFSGDSAPEMPPEVRQIVNKVIKLPHEKIKILNDVLDTWVESD